MEWKEKAAAGLTELGERDGGAGAGEGGLIRAGISSAEQRGGVQTAELILDQEQQVDPICLQAEREEEFLEFKGAVRHFTDLMTQNQRRVQV